MTPPPAPVRLVLDTNVLLRAMVNRASRSRDVVPSALRHRIQQQMVVGVATSYPFPAGTTSE